MYTLTQHTRALTQFLLSLKLCENFPTYSSFLLAPLWRHLEFVSVAKLGKLGLVVLNVYINEFFELLQPWIGNVAEGMLNNIIDFSYILHPSMLDTFSEPIIDCDKNVTITWKHDNRVSRSWIKFP